MLRLREHSYDYWRTLAEEKRVIVREVGSYQARNLSIEVIPFFDVRNHPEVRVSVSIHLDGVSQPLLTDSFILSPDGRFVGEFEPDASHRPMGSFRELREKMESRGTRPTTSALVAGLIVAAAWFGGVVVLVLGVMFMFPPDGSTPEPIWGAGFALMGLLVILIPWAGVRSGEMSPWMQVLYAMVFAAIIVGGLVFRSLGTVLIVVCVALSIPVIQAIQKRNTDDPGQ